MKQMRGTLLQMVWGLPSLSIIIFLGGFRSGAGSRPFVTRKRNDVAFQRPWIPRNEIKPKVSRQNVILHYATDGTRNHIGSKKALLTDRHEQLIPIYEKVSKQDPLWYDKFVLNVLGVDVAKDIGLPDVTTVQSDLSNCEIEMNETEQTFATEKYSSSNMNETTPLEVSTATASVLIVDSQVEADELMERESVFMKDLKDALTENDFTRTKISSTKVKENPSTASVSAGAKSPKNITDKSAFEGKDTSEERDVRKVETPPMKEETTNVSGKQYRNVTKKSRQEIVRQASSAIPAEEPHEGESVGAIRNNDEKLIVYQKSSSSRFYNTLPLEKFTRLGYSNDEIISLQADVLEVILADNVSRPRAGLPLGWQRPRSTKHLSQEVEIFTRSEFESLQQENQNESTELPSSRNQVTSNIGPCEKFISNKAEQHGAFMRTRSKVSSKSLSDKRKYSEESVTRGGSIQNLESDALSTSDSAAESKPVRKSKGVNESTQRNESVQSTTKQSIKKQVFDKMESPQGEARASERDRAFGLKEDLTVVFFDKTQNNQRMVSLSLLESLGYEKEEVMSLHPDVLATILANSTRKPSSAIPTKWRAPKDGVNSEYNIQVMNRSNAEAFLSRNENRRVARKKAEYSSDIRDRRLQGRKERQERSRQKTAYNPDGSKKRVYSGRGENAPMKSSFRRRGDPPSPQKFWPDIDKFRDMLRSEAEFRLIFTGGKMAKAVKDESEWRLRLYESWLWKLDEGVGEPMVPSRNERRRMIPPSAKMPTRKPTRRRRREM